MTKRNIFKKLCPAVEFYNLSFERVGKKLSERDKEALSRYLNRHAPHIFAEDAAPSRMVYHKRGMTEIYGTLKMYQETTGEDWFSSPHAQNLAALWRDVRMILDAHVDGELAVRHLRVFEALLDLFKPALVLIERVGSKSRGRAIKDLQEMGRSELVNLQVWEPLWGAKVVSVNNVSKNYKLAIGGTIASIVFGVYLLLQTRWPMSKCAFPGCQKIFVPHPQAPKKGLRKQKYCPGCKRRRESAAK